MVIVDFLNICFSCWNVNSTVRLFLVLKCNLTLMFLKMNCLFTLFHCYIIKAQVYCEHDVCVFACYFSWLLCDSATSWSLGSTISWWRTREWMAAPLMWTSSATYTKRSGIYSTESQQLMWLILLSAAFDNSFLQWIVFLCLSFCFVHFFHFLYTVLMDVYITGSHCDAFICWWKWCLH